MKPDYIESVLSKIKDKGAKSLVEAELKDHIEERIDCFMEIGYDRDRAEELAVENMGDPEEIAVPLDVLHSRKWYKESALYYSVGYFIIQLVIMTFFTNRFKYIDAYFSIVHFVTADFVSLFMIAAGVFAVYKSYSKNRLVPICITAVTVILTIFTHTFEPAMYSISKLCTSGIRGYCDSIFGYGYVKYEDGICPQMIYGLSVIITTALLCDCIFSFMIVYLKQMGKNKSTFKPYKVFQKAMCIFLGFNFVLMGLFTAIAVSNLEQKYSDNKELRKKQIDEIIHINFYPSKHFDYIIEELDMVFNDVTKDGSFIDTYTAHKDNTELMVTDFGENYVISHNITSVFSKYALLNRDLYVDGEIIKNLESEALTITKNDGDVSTVINQSKYDDKNPYTFSDFLQEDIYYNAISFSRSGAGDLSKSGGKDYNIIFMLKDSEYDFVQLVFLENKLTDIRYTNIGTEFVIS